MQSCALPPLNGEHSEELLNAADARFDFSLKSWVVENAAGVPGVLLAAARIGADLRRDGGGFIDQVAKGFERKAEQTLQERDSEALRALALMSHVGIEGEEQVEAETVARHFGVDLHIILDALERIEAAGFIRRDGSYAEVIPPPLANRLAARVMRGRLQAVKSFYEGARRVGATTVSAPACSIAKRGGAPLLERDV